MRRTVLSAAVAPAHGRAEGCPPVAPAAATAEVSAGRAQLRPEQPSPAPGGGAFCGVGAATHLPQSRRLHWKKWRLDGMSVGSPVNGLVKTCASKKAFPGLHGGAAAPGNAGWDGIGGGGAALPSALDFALAFPSTLRSGSDCLRKFFLCFLPILCPRTVSGR